MQRDQEQRDTVAGTLRNLRTEATRQTLALEKLQTRNEDLARQVSLAQSQERSARAALRTAESTARGLREEMARLKTTVQQVRTSCANDVRKRDLQIQRLKGHLTGQQRGNKAGPVGASITINPGIIGAGGMATSMRDEVPGVDDPEYSLKQETTEFLTQLSQSLSDENDNLIGLVRSAIITLKELQGMSEELREDEDLSVIREEEEGTQQGMLHTLPTSYEGLASNLETCLDSLKHLLTNPNFVSLEEVESREEEILRLRAGWEKMEMKLREAFTMMEMWSRRMADGGDTINLEELKMGLGLGHGLDSINKEDMSMIAEDEEEEEEEEEEEDLEDEDAVSSVFDEDPEDPDEIANPPSPEPEARPSSDIFNVKLHPKPAALQETNGNSKAPSRSPRKVAFSASIPNTPSQLDENADSSSIGKASAGKPRSTGPTPRSEERSSRPTGQKVRCDMLATRICELASKVTISSPSPLHSRFSYPVNPNLAFPILSPFKSTLGGFSSNEDDPNEDYQTKKRLSLEAHPDEPSPKLTVHDKLKVAQAEAEAAASTITIRNSPAKRERSLKLGESAEAGAGAGEKRQRRASRSSPVKTRISGRPKRRKSTLTPEELDNLLGVESW